MSVACRYPALLATLFTLCASAPALASHIAAGTYYVATNGSDSNPGTLAQPWKTLQKAATSAGPGVTVQVRGGVYNERVNIKASGSATAGYFVLQNYPGETPVLDGSNLTAPASTTGLVTLTDTSYVKVMGFELRNYSTSKSSATPAGILIEGAGTYIEIRNNYVHHISTEVKSSAGNAFGIAVYGSKAPASINHLTLDGNHLTNLKTGSSESMVVNGNVENFVISHNRVHDNNNIGIDAIGYEGTSPNPSYDRARNGIISDNLVYNISSKGNPAYGNDMSADGIYVDGGSNITIERNTVHHVDIGIEAASEHKGKLTDYITIRNNLIYQNNTVGMYYSTNNQFSNNIVVASRQGRFLSAASRPTTSPLAMNNNVYFSPLGLAQGTWQWKGADYKGLSAFSKASGNDGQSQFVDPLFVDAAKGNFALSPNSPAKGKGASF
ncbi:MAG: right-handed parallel beta-helix repeat-containing protein [Burkholderiales bacterium]|nr:right-handed parallel beta-helix repeat-containing protein [Burkholderiales bacterium]